jgi:hypothetical protein
MADKLDATAIAQRAHKYATAVVRSAAPCVGPEYDEVFYAHFARLVLEEAAKVCENVEREPLVVNHYNRKPACSTNATDTCHRGGGMPS